MRNDKENVIMKLSFQFALKIIEFSKLLEQERKYVVARQLRKSGTSISTNIHETQNAESRADFIHKMKIAVKEADETMCWILICEEASGYPFQQQIIKNQLTSIIKILSKIISATKQVA